MRTTPPHPQMVFMQQRPHEDRPWWVTPWGRDEPTPSRHVASSMARWWGRGEVAHHAAARPDMVSRRRVDVDGPRRTPALGGRATDRASPVRSMPTLALLAIHCFRIAPPRSASHFWRTIPRCHGDSSALSGGVIGFCPGHRHSTCTPAPTTGLTSSWTARSCSGATSASARTR